MSSLSGSLSEELSMLSPLPRTHRSVKSTLSACGCSVQHLWNLGGNPTFTLIKSASWTLCLLKELLSCGMPQSKDTVRDVLFSLGCSSSTLPRPQICCLRCRPNQSTHKPSLVLVDSLPSFPVAIFPSARIHALG